jgi:hypothetical protein
VEDNQITQRLTAMEVLLQGILAALAPPESEGAGFDDMVEALSDLTVAVADMAETVRALRSNGSVPPREPAAR